MLSEVSEQAVADAFAVVSREADEMAFGVVVTGAAGFDLVAQAFVMHVRRRFLRGSNGVPSGFCWALMRSRLARRRSSATCLVSARRWSGLSRAMSG